MCNFVKCENKNNLGGNMVILDLKVDNFYGFKAFHMNMSYPRKIVNSLIPDEHLKQRPNFRYRKVNILMGGNATGKTSVGQMLKIVFNGIKKKDLSLLSPYICNTNDKATFSIDIVPNAFFLYRIEGQAIPAKTEEDNGFDMQVCVKEVSIQLHDSYERCVKKLEKQPSVFTSDCADELSKVREKLSWHFIHPDDKPGIFKDKRGELYEKILEMTLKTLDPSIQSVKELDEAENSYVIKRKYDSLLVQNGEVIRSSRLSSGTLEGIAIADILYSLKNEGIQFFYCDEKFSHVHSTVEIAFLSIMIEALGENQQLFFTTHNTDVLDLRLPMHTYNFLKKEDLGDEYRIACINAGAYLKRNTDSLRNAIENDLFSIAPQLDLLYTYPDF